MKKKNLHKIISYSIAAVWLVNGLFCKVLNFVPRHREIVANIIGHEYSKSFTIIIGFAEILMAVWILTGWK
ncbi:DoxX-like family protein, partial [Elizabethkingia meningoseptica]